MIALIDLGYPANLEQYFHGFEFLLFKAPSEVNYVQANLPHSDRDKPFSERYDSFGYSSSFFLVQEVAFYTLFLGILTINTLVVACIWMMGKKQNGIEGGKLA